MKNTTAPGVTPQRHTTYETTAKVDKITPCAEGEAKHEIEQINRHRRGYEVATARVNLSIAQSVHLQAHIKLGVQQLNTDITRQDFQRTAWNLIGKKTQTAIAEDNARGLISEHGLNQTTIKARLEGIELNTVDVRVKNQDRRSELLLDGTLSRFTLANAAT